jgi:hypothetical protein
VNATWTPRRVRATGWAAAAGDAQIVAAQIVGAVYTGGKITVALTVQSSSGGVVTCSGAIAYPSPSDNVVIGHFDTGTVTVPAGGSATLELTSRSVVSDIYADQSLEFMFSPDSSLANAAVGTAVSQINPGYTMFTTVHRGSLLTSPYFMPAAIGVGVLALGGLLYLALD